MTKTLLHKIYIDGREHIVVDAARASRLEALQSRLEDRNNTAECLQKAISGNQHLQNRIAAYEEAAKGHTFAVATMQDKNDELRRLLNFSENLRIELQNALPNGLVVDIMGSDSVEIRFGDQVFVPKNSAPTNRAVVKQRIDELEHQVEKRRQQNEEQSAEIEGLRAELREDGKTVEVINDN